MAHIARTQINPRIWLLSDGGGTPISSIAAVCQVQHPNGVFEDCRMLLWDRFRRKILMDVPYEI